MREGVLFEITKEGLETGLRGVPVGYCITSYVDPQKGLTYVGRPISELAHSDPMEVIYLLYHGKMGAPVEIASFKADLEKRAFLNPETLRHIDSLPRTGSPMDAFAASILITGLCEKKGNYREDCLDLIAKIPQITATLINHHAGWGPTPPSRPELGYIENFIHMLQAPNKTAKLTEVIRMFETVHLDHCGGNLSTFTGKAVASGLENMYGSIAAAMTALAGLLHGGANQDSLKFVQSVLDEVGESATPADIERLIRRKLEHKELVFGFGHAVLRVEDPRATVFYRYCQQHFPHHPLVKTALLLRTEGPKVLKENPKVSNPYPNIDAISGSMLTAAGFPYPEYFTLLFGMSRAVGIAIQIVYERLEARGGKGTPIIRPLYLYKTR